MKVYFRDSHNKERFLEEVTTKEDAWKVMQNFMNDHNFKCYYTRIWYVDGYTWFDVGSHTEYFMVDENLMGYYEDEQEEEKTLYNTAQRDKQTFGYQPE